MAISNVTFSQNLVRIRKEKGFSQKELSERAKISHRMLVHYEKHVTYPPIDKIDILADALGVSISELLGASKDNKNDSGTYDVRIRKSFNKILQLNKHDRSKIFQLVNILLQKPEYQSKGKRSA